MVERGARPSLVVSGRVRLFERQIMKRASRLVLILFAFASLVSGCRRQGGTFTLPQPATGNGASVNVEHNSYADVVSKVAPAVATIRAERRVRAPQQHPVFDDPFLQGLVGAPAP